MKVEYRVRPVTRYIVTRFYDDGVNGGCGVKGEYESEDVAYQVGYALAKAEHEILGYPVADDRIQYPNAPNTPPAVENA